MAVKAIIEAPGVVTLFIALPIIKIEPALQRARAVLPRIHEVQRAVPSVPIAGVIITSAIANLIGFLVQALCYLAADLDIGSRCDVSPGATREAVVQDVAEKSIEAFGTDAVVVWSLSDVLAGAAIVTGVISALSFRGILTFGTSKGRGA